MSRIALVSGGGSGIGRAAALALTGSGWTVAICGRNRSRLDRAIAETGAVAAIACDVTDAAAVDRLYDEIDGTFGRLDLLFNNAGSFSRAAPLEDVALDEWRATLDVNLTGYFLMTRGAVRLMKRQTPPGGRIINNGSISAQVPRPDSVGYAAAKHGVTGLTKATMLEGRRFGIACGQIDIGNAATDLTGDFTAGMLQADGAMRAEPVFDVRHVGALVSTIAALPLDVNVPAVTIVATGMPFGGRG